MFIQLFSICFDVTWCGLMLDPIQTKYTKGFQTARAHGWFFWRHFSSSQSPAGRKSSKIAGSAWKGLEEKPEGYKWMQDRAWPRRWLNACVFPKSILVLFMRAEVASVVQNPDFSRFHLKPAARRPVRCQQWAIRIDPVDSEWFRCVVDVCNINISVMMYVFFRGNYTTCVKNKYILLRTHICSGMQWKCCRDAWILFVSSGYRVSEPQDSPLIGSEVRTNCSGGGRPQGLPCVECMARNIMWRSWPTNW